MRLKTAVAVLAAFVFLTGCASLPESNRAAEETAWEISYQLGNGTGLTIAVADFEAVEVPEALVQSFRNELGTYLAIAFRESGMDHKVVTRDRVDAIFQEQSLELQGLARSDARIRIGELLGADVLVTGNILWLEDDQYRASTQLIETESGIILGGTYWDFWFDTESAE